MRTFTEMTPCSFFLMLFKCYFFCTCSLYIPHTVQSFRIITSSSMQGKEVYECVVVSDGSGFFKKRYFSKNSNTQTRKISNLQRIQPWKCWNVANLTCQRIETRPDSNSMKFELNQALFRRGGSCSDKKDFNSRSIDHWLIMSILTPHFYSGNRSYKN